MPAKRSASKPRYQPHPMLALEAKALQALADETGRTWDQWIALARRKGPRQRQGLKRWLQHEHGMTNMRAHWIAGGVLDDGPSHDQPEPLVDALYSGSRLALRPLHEKVVDVALALGPDVVVSACKTMVPIFRKHVFAELRPVDGAVEVQLALGEAAAEGRLEPAEGRAIGDRLSHRVRVRQASEVDAELRAWMAQAYERGATRQSRGSVDVEIPPEIAKGLKASAPARATWETCTPAMRRDLVQWIVSAKKDETRAKRVAAVLDALKAGKKRVY
jgi:hypothetical protein